MIADQRDPLAGIYNKSFELAQEFGKLYHLNDEQIKILEASIRFTTMGTAIRIRIGDGDLSGNDNKDMLC